eukprot:3696234-Amphidinium_carterae.1
MGTAIRCVDLDILRCAVLMRREVMIQSLSSHKSQQPRFLPPLSFPTAQVVGILLHATEFFFKTYPRGLPTKYKWQDLKDVLLCDSAHHGSHCAKFHVLR